MSNTDISPEKKFDIHASIVFKLGEDLISDEVQALVELIKNAYDADADYAKVTIETGKKNLSGHSRYRDAHGYIQIEDNGHGMDETAIDRGWLTVSNSLKREMKSRGKITERGRTPLGDKGLGRLGSQRLGENIEIFSKPGNEDYEYHVAFSWKDFENIEFLSRVPVYFEKKPSKEKSKTTILISGIKRPDSLKTEKYKENLQKELSRMISPYKEIKHFTVFITIDGREIDLAEISENVLDTSQVRYTLDFDGKKLMVKGIARLSFFRPRDKRDSDDRILFKSLVEVDNGQAFFDYLSGNENAKKFNMVKSDKPGWFIEYERVIPFEDIDKLEFINEKRVNPGRFNGRIDSFDLGVEEGKHQNVFDTISEYREYIKDLSGIRIYRDGFGIRVGRDWLGLGQQATSGRSSYGLRVNNILGYIALSALENRNLEETTDREGFIVNAYYINFYKTLGEFVKFTEVAQDFLRRGWNQFLNYYREKVGKIKAPFNTPEQLAKKINQSISKAPAYRDSAQKVIKLLDKKSEIADKIVNSISLKPPVKPADVKRLTALINELRQSVDDARESIASLQEYVNEIESLKSFKTILENQIEHLREQLGEVYETVSLGLTAEALSHEIYNVIDRLESMASDIRGYLKKQPGKDAKVVSFVEHVRTSVNALRKQLAHLAPSLKYVREKKEHIDVLSFCRKLAGDYYNERLNKNKITINIDASEKGNFSIYMNRGKLTQVFDNLFLNNEYWLREDIRVGNIRDGIITVTIANPFVRVHDNGRGVLPLVEASLFEPFITTKSRGEGRGLGLFIIQQLLESEGGTISLLPERNQHLRRYIFEIDFSGSLNERH